MSQETQTRTILHRYSEEELNAVREKFSADQISLEELKDEKKQVVAGYGKRIKDAETMQKELRSNIKNKSEYREIEVQERPNFATGMMEYYETVHGDLVDQRRLLPDERQHNMFVMDPAKSA